ncbi:MAG TPA: DoxX family protein [Chthoniobacteraceae bacterium]|nr:DoxX family protein [Chthoniobacteraceae bacterium]
MLLKFLGKYRDAGLLIMRVGLGIMFMLHGLPDLIAGPKKWAVLGAAMGNLGIPFYPKLWGFLACATEGIGGLLLAIGIFYRPICLLLAFTMVVATLKHYKAGDDFLAKTSRPLELAMVFFGLSFVGPGRFSVYKD